MQRWKQDALDVRKLNGYVQVTKPRTITKIGRKGKTIYRTKPRKETWVEPALAKSLDPNATNLVVDIIQCSNFGYSHIIRFYSMIDI